MRFATYQAAQIDSSKIDNKMSILRDYLGYEPTFALNCSSARSLVMDSVLCEPSYPEELVFYETDEFIRINKAEWYRLLFFEDYNFKITDELFNIVDDRCVEYITKSNKDSSFVKYISHIPVPLKDFSFDIRCSNFPEFTNFISGFIHKCVSAQENFSFSSDSDNVSDEVVRKAYLKYCKLHLESLLPLFYYLVFEPYNIDIENICIVSPSLFNSGFRNRFYTWDSDCSLESFLRFYEELSCYVNPINSYLINHKVGPNESCPCHSGKKFKKCCGKYL